MKTKLLCAVLGVITTGCTHFKTTQQDIRGEHEQITTTVSGTAWFTSAQTLAKIKASQTEKTQTVGLDGVSQHGATNSVAALNAIANILNALKPTP